LRAAAIPGTPLVAEHRSATWSSHDMRSAKPGARDGLITTPVPGAAAWFAWRVLAGQPRLIEPTIILVAPPDSKVMTEEVFGPVLPIQTYDAPSDLLHRLRAAPKPLAPYVFSDDTDFVSTVLAGTSSGGVTVNGFGTTSVNPESDSGA